MMNRQAFLPNNFKMKNTFEDEISLYFFSKMSEILQPRDFSNFIRSDKDAFKWYSDVVKNLLYVNNSDKVKIQYVKSVLDGKINDAKKLLAKSKKIQGII